MIFPYIDADLNGISQPRVTTPELHFTSARIWDQTQDLARTRARRRIIAHGMVKGIVHGASICGCTGSMSRSSLVSRNSLTQQI